MNANDPRSKGHHRPLVLRVWRNPLARGVDRAEAVLVVGLAVVWALSLPLIATIASVEWSGIDARLAADRNSVVATEAVVTGDAALTVTAHEAVSLHVVAHATWIGRDGRPADGLVRVPAGVASGDRVTIWLDRQGNVVAEPMTSAGAATLMVMGTVGAWVGLGLGLAAVWWVIRRRFDRIRWSQWESDWAAFPTDHHSP